MRPPELEPAELAAVSGGGGGKTAAFERLVTTLKNAHLNRNEIERLANHFEQWIRAKERTVFVAKRWQVGT